MCIPPEAYVICGTKMLRLDSFIEELGLVGGCTPAWWWFWWCMQRLFLSLVSGCMVCAMPTGVEHAQLPVFGVGVVEASRSWMFSFPWFPLTPDRTR